MTETMVSLTTACRRLPVKDHHESQLHLTSVSYWETACGYFEDRKKKKNGLRTINYLNVDPFVMGLMIIYLPNFEAEQVLCMRKTLDWPRYVCFETVSFVQFF